MEQWLSAPRFATYLGASGQDRRLALELYEWNTAVSAAVLHDLSHLEVALRNAYDAAIVAHSPAGTAHWTSDVNRYFPPIIKRVRDGSRYDINTRPREQITYARRTANSATPGKVIAELSFGFWRYLSSSAHATSLWMPYLRHGFVAGTGRQAVDEPMRRVHRLRNRVAHHEPLLATDLTARHHDVTTLAGCISPDLTAHITATSTWLPVLGQRPAGT